MSSSKKTLIIFDTNALRHNKEDPGFSYTFLDFSQTYRELDEFIGRYALSENVKIAIPKIVLEELLQQKYESFVGDIQGLKEKAKLFKDFTLVRLNLPDENFDYRKDIDEKLAQSLRGKPLIIVDYPKKESFDKIIKKAIKRESPFSSSSKHKDHGFKDVVIWESILHYEPIKEFDKVIFMTGDSDFDNEYCKKEFASSFNKYFVILNSKEQLFKELSNDYGIPLFDDKYMKFAYTGYYCDYLLQQCKNKRMVRLSNGDMKIDKIEIAHPFVKLEVVDDETKAELEKWIVSLLRIDAHDNTGKITMTCEVKVAVDESLGLDTDSIEFQYELLE